MIILIFLLICLIICLFVTCNGIRYYTIRPVNTPLALPSLKPHVLILATTHGNEPAGFYALHRLIDSNPIIKNGLITLIPSVNTCGRISNTRNNPLGDYDINRNYTKDVFLNKELLKFIKKADWIIDLHEGWGFAKVNKQSIGSGIYPGNTKPAKDMTVNLIHNINTKITEDYKKFSTIELTNIPGSLRDICNNLNKNYILVETSGIKDIQPKELRIQQQLSIVTNILQILLGV